MLGSERAVADRGAPPSPPRPGARRPRYGVHARPEPGIADLRHAHPLQRGRLDRVPARSHPGHPREGGDQARARLEHARRRHAHAPREGSQAHRAHPAAVPHPRRHGPLVAGPRGARLRAGAFAEEPRRAQGHRRVPPLRRADRHLRGQAHHRAGGAGEHLSPRPLGRARDHRAVHDRAAPPGHLGARGHVLGPAGGGRPARPLPEPLGGPGDPQQ